MLRFYTYVGPQQIQDASRRSAPGVVVKTNADLRKWLSENGLEADVDGSITATFVIDQNGDLRLAPRRSEHVACAGGGPVLSAGEITFSTTGEVIEINNHSTGFCPEPESWTACEAALSRIDVNHPHEFTKTVVFRLCPKCNERNIVKDNWFSCDLCGSELPSNWNFYNREA